MKGLIRRSLNRLQETNTVRDLAIAVMAHDLRNPLNSIVAWTQILQRGGFDKRTFADLTANMTHSGMRMSKLI